MKPALDGRAEWLEADGLGGFASGTVSGVRTRRYHALLLVATTPPTGRHVLVNGFDAWLETPAGLHALSSQRYTPEVVHPDGHKRLEAFEADPWPRWIYRLEDGTRVEQNVFVPKGAPIVAVSWRLLEPGSAGLLRVRPFLSGRDYHSLHHENAALRSAAEVEGERGVSRSGRAFHTRRSRVRHAPRHPHGRRRASSALSQKFRCIRAPMHPGPRRCSSLAYQRYARSSRLAIRAPRRSRCYANLWDRTLAAGAPGVQLTWMDAKVGDWVVTPRMGKPVEVQALWLNALRIGSRLDGRWEEPLAKASASFAARFWNEESGYLHDVVDAGARAGAVDSTFRPNQILAVGGAALRAAGRRQGPTRCRRRGEAPVDAAGPIAASPPRRSSC